MPTAAARDALVRRKTADAPHIKSDALANLIDAASAVLENGEPPYSWPVYAAREMRDALAALIGGAR